MDLVKLITEKVESVHSSGKLDEIIEKHVLECLYDVVRDSFRWNGEAKKQIEEALKGKLGISMENVKIPQYQKMVSTIVNDQLSKTIVADLQNDIVETVNGITEVLEKKEWKLSEIVKAFIDDIDKSYDGMDDHYGECSFHVNTDGSFSHISLDKESDKDWHYCELRFHLYKGKLSSVTVDDKPFSPFAVRSMSHFDEFMFKLYCNNVDVIIDESDCELEYCREDCE